MKAIAVIFNRRFTATITFHNFLHEFQAGRDKGTTTLEVNMLQQVAALREAALHAIFLDLHKEYDALDRSRCLGILEDYGLEPRSLRLLQRYWERLKMLDQAGGYYRSSFCR